MACSSINYSTDGSAISLGMSGSSRRTRFDSERRYLSRYILLSPLSGGSPSYSQRWSSTSFIWMTLGSSCFAVVGRLERNRSKSFRLTTRFRANSIEHPLAQRGRLHHGSISMCNIDAKGAGLVRYGCFLATAVHPAEQ